MSGYTYPGNALNIMVDLETVSTHHNAGIVSIGAQIVKFGSIVTEENPESFYGKCDTRSLNKHGFHIDPETIDWWKKQDAAVKAETFSGTQEISQLLTSFDLWVRNVKVIHNDAPLLIWGNAAEFDCSILVDAYDLLHMHTPWSYRNHRCYRTLNALYKAMVFRPSGLVEQKHNALYDAKLQANRLEQILERIYSE